MRNYLRFLIFLYVFIGFSWAKAGSYDDFFTAIKRDDAWGVSTLLQRGFDPDTTDPKGIPALIVAIREPSPKAALTLIRWPQTQVEARNADGESALMLAAFKGYEDLVAALIARGADVNKTGWTPLHYAATNGHIGVIKQLLEASAYIDAESPNGSTPLMMAAQYGSLDTVKLLLDEGADPTLKNQLGLTAIDFARRVGREDAAAQISRAIRARQPRGTW
jgi:ankyrin repeat protein